MTQISGLIFGVQHFSLHPKPIYIWLVKGPHISCSKGYGSLHVRTSINFSSGSSETDWVPENLEDGICICPPMIVFAVIWRLRNHSPTSFLMSICSVMLDQFKHCSCGIRLNSGIGGNQRSAQLTILYGYHDCLMLESVDAKKWSQFQGCSTFLRELS